MKEFVDVNTGDVEVLRGNFILRAMAIGSCIVIAGFDSKTNVAAMAHIMLPGCARKTTEKQTKYALNGIDYMLNQMLKFGCQIKDIEVCLVGGGNVLKKKSDSICTENIKSVTNILKEKAISVKASVVGGYERKSAFLDAETGSFSFTEGDSVQQPLWQSKEIA